MTVNTHTNGKVPASILAHFGFGPKDPQAPSEIVAAPVKATPAVETPQKQGARTRAKNAAWQQGVEQRLDTLVEIVAELAKLQATPQAAPQAAPQATPPTPQAAPTPQAPKAGYNADNLKAVNAALKAKGCGCKVAFPAHIWKNSGLTVRKQANGKNVKSLWYPNETYPRGINGKIIQMHCACTIERI